MISDKIKNYAVGFEEYLSGLIREDSKEYSVVADACRYSLLIGGKRLRPFLIREFYTLCGGKGDHSKNFEAAIEFIHTYSLIHDDLPCMDNDDMRRGKPSCHIKFGEANALLAGDALLTEAFGIASKTENISAENLIKAITALSEYAGINGMIGGQTVDLLYEEKAADEEVLSLICRLKTGALIKSACTIGCLLAGADQKQINAAKEYAEAVGIAFQMVDDILDETGSAEKLGKPIHSDKENNKSTFVSLLGIEECRRRVAELTEKAKAAVCVFGDKANDLIDLADYLCKRDY